MTWANTNSVYGAQIFVDTDPTNTMAFRSRSSAGVWTGWNTVVHSGNIGSQSVNYATSAGTVAWSNVSSKPGDIMYYQGFTLDANTMNPNSTGFTYGVNAPFTGPIARFSTGGGYDLWLNSPYHSGGLGLALEQETVMQQHLIAGNTLLFIMSMLMGVVLFILQLFMTKITRVII